MMMTIQVGVGLEFVYREAHTQRCRTCNGRRVCVHYVGINRHWTESCQVRFLPLFITVETSGEYIQER